MGKYFRTKSIFLYILVISLICGYFYFFFEKNIKWALEYTATKANGAEVNIGDFDINLKKAKITIRNIQVTDRKKPTHNLFSLNNLTGDIQIAPLLKAKTIIDLIQISSLDIGGKRKRPGKVLKDQFLALPEILEESKAATNKTIADKYKNTLINNFYQLAKGESLKKQVNIIKDNLSSLKQVKKVEDLLKSKEDLWKKNIADLPDKNALKELEEQFKKIRDSKPKGATAIALQVKTASELIKNTKSKIKKIKETKSNFKTDLSAVNLEVKKIETSIKSDVEDLKKKFNVSSFDTDSLLESVLKPIIMERISFFYGYIAKMREKIPFGLGEVSTEENQKAKKEKQKVNAFEGKNYAFGNKNSLPKFLIKKINIDGKISMKGYQGNIGGKIINVTDNQALVGSPMKIDLSANFAGENKKSILTNIIVNHTNPNQPQETGKISIKGLPIDKINLANSNKLKFTAKELVANFDVNFNILDEKVDLKISSLLDNLKFNFDADNKQVKNLLSLLSDNLTTVDLTTALTGTWSDLSTKFGSNLDKLIGNSLKQSFSKDNLKQQFEIEKKIQSMVNSDETLSKINKFREKYELSLESKEAFVQSLQKKLETEKQNLVSKNKEKLENKVKDKGKKLLNDLFKKL